MPRFATARRNEMLDTLINNLNSGILRLYSGTRPTDANTALSGNTVLAELTLNATSAASASNGVLTLNAITSDASANASGTATFARVFESDGTTVVVDLSVGTSGTEIVLNTTSVTAGVPVSISSATITLPVGS